MKYNYSSGEIFKTIGSYFVFICATAYLFFDSYKAFIVLLLFLPFYISQKKRKLISKRNEELCHQFSEMISVIATSISAGMSVENAFRESMKDMEKMFGSDSHIVKAIEEIIRKLDMNISIEVGLRDFSKEICIDDVSDFVSIFTEATRNGGNLKEIITDTVSLIQEKRRVEEEIASMLKGKMLEQRVISVIPFIIFLYLRISSKEFTDVLYHNPFGITAMTFCLILYISSLWVSERIIDIRV